MLPLSLSLTLLMCKTYVAFLCDLNECWFLNKSPFLLSSVFFFLFFFLQVQAPITGFVSGLNLPLSEPNNPLPALTTTQDRPATGHPSGFTACADGQPKPCAGTWQPWPGVCGLSGPLLDQPAHGEVRETHRGSMIFQALYVKARVYEYWVNILTC